MFLFQSLEIKRKIFNMKLSFIILTTFFTLTFASPVSIIDSSLITDNLSELLYNNLNPIFQNTFQQLTELIFEFSEKFSQIKLSRSDSVKPAEWVSQLFNGTNSIGAQWNSHITDFFGNIPTVFENNDRSLFDFSLIKTKLYIAVKNLLIKLKQLFDNNINQLWILFINEFKLTKSDFDVLSNDFQQQVSGVFNNTKEELNQTIDDLIDSILTYWNDLKDRFFG